MAAAETQFDKAEDLLKLPHITKKSIQRDGQPVIIVDPANAAVFNAARQLNESASKLARTSLGLVSDRVGVDVTSNGKSLGALSD